MFSLATKNHGRPTAVSNPYNPYGKDPDRTADDRGAAHDALYTNIRSRKVGGTPTTMAPEVWRAYMGQGTFGMKCDIYSLGVVLFQLLTGSEPFMHSSIDAPEWIAKIRRGPPMEKLTDVSP